MDHESIRKEHPHLFTCNLQSIFTLLDEYDQELKSINDRHDRGELSERALRSELRKVKYSREVALQVISIRSNDASGVFGRKSACDDRTSKSDSTPVIRSVDPSLPNLLKQSSTFCGDIDLEPDVELRTESPAFHSPTERRAPEPHPLPRSPRHNMADARPNPPMWKSLPKHLVPLTGKESMDTLETKLDLCADTVANDPVTVDQYIRSLTTVAVDPLLSFLKKDIVAVMPLYATINDIPVRVKTAILQRFDRPSHEYAFQVLNPSFQPRETPLQFLNRLRHAAARATFPTDQQPKMTLIRALKHIPELSHVLFRQPPPTYEVIVNDCINILVMVGEKLEASSTLPTSSAGNIRRTFATNNVCDYCGKSGHEVRNCWQKYPNKKPTTDQMFQLLSFMNGEQEAEYVPQPQRLDRAFARMMGTENAANLRSNRGMKDYLLQELFRSMLRSRCSIPIEKFLPMLVSDYPQLENLLLADYAQPEVPPARPTRRPVQDPPPNTALPSRRPQRNTSQPRNGEQRIPRIPRGKAKAKAGADGYMRATFREQLNDVARNIGLTPETPADNVEVNLTTGMVTPIDEQRDNNSNFISQLFSQMLSDLNENGEVSDYDDDEGSIADNDEDGESQMVNFQFMNIDGLDDKEDDANVVDGQYSHIYENQSCGSLPFTTMSINDIKVPALLDSGSVFNMLRNDVAEAVGAVIKKKEGLYTTGSGKGKTIGTTTVKVSLASQPPTPITFTVVNEHPLQAIIGYPQLKKKSQLCLTQIVDHDEWTKTGEDLPAAHQEVLKILAPTIPCKNIEHEFKMGTLVQPLPFQEPLRRINEAKTKYLLEWIPQGIASGLIEAGELGDFLSPLVLVSHYDKNKVPIPGEFRVCLDAGRVNKAFMKIPIAMPLISEVVSDLSRFPYKAVIDLKWAFNHMTLTDDQKKFFGFPTPIGTFRFARAPFGFINSPSNQQFVMSNRVDKPFRLAWRNLVRFISSFVDDIHLGSMTMDDLLVMILEVLKHLAAMNYTVIPKSIQFGTAIDALGQRVSLRGSSIESRHQQTIAALKPAATAKAWKSLNAFLSYFRGYVPHFSARTKEIRLCACSKRPADSPAAVSELNDIKEALMSAPALRKPPTGANLVLESDFSTKGLGAALFFEEGRNLILSKVISRRTTEAETKYSAIEGETTALLWALKEMQAEVLSGQRLQVITDHQPLEFLLKGDLNQLSVSNSLR